MAWTAWSTPAERFQVRSRATVVSIDETVATEAQCRGDHRVRATVSHREIGVGGLRNRTAQVIDVVSDGVLVVLVVVAVHAVPIADIVPHRGRGAGPQET